MANNKRTVNLIDLSLIILTYLMEVMLNAIISNSTECSVIPQTQNVVLGEVIIPIDVILAKFLKVIIQTVKIKNAGADQLREPIVTRKLKL